jgi:hypothetical protein
MNKISEKMYEALTLKYRSEMAEAEATLLIYFNNPVGIGEHPLEMLETVYKHNTKRDEMFEVTEEMLKIIKEK